MWPSFLRPGVVCQRVVPEGGARLACVTIRHPLPPVLCAMTIAPLHEVVLHSHAFFFFFRPGFA